jgi:hypothetical protein
MNLKSALNRCWPLMAVLLCGCSTVHRPAAVTGPLQIPVKYLESNHADILQSERPVNARAILRAIPGGVFGMPQGPIESRSISSSDTLSIDLERLLTVYAEAAQTLQAGPATAGLTIKPADVRLARVGTLIDYQSAPRAPTRVGFEDGDSGDMLILVYFNKPCRLAGTIAGLPRDAGMTKAVFDVTIDSAGFHWLTVKTNMADGIATLHEARTSVVPTYILKY